MALRVISFRVSDNIIQFLRQRKSFLQTYDEIINKLVTECAELVPKVNDFSIESLSVQTFKLSQYTIERLDFLSKYYGMTRSEVFRKLVLAKAEGLC
ncbi:transcriptional regulator [Betalipothrixvirus uzonense]|uniref:Uncharacterized protein n=1 Tax=Betalipothrixvirus uzonense TaxID=512792 RepID=B2CRK4_9VIRU|nr:transcriptional regulator [Acidianus filamentous virus 9]ACB37261.1 hypothetical protein [Acidianus filamentous virus 9]